MASTYAEAGRTGCVTCGSGMLYSQCGALTLVWELHMHIILDLTLPAFDVALEKAAVLTYAESGRAVCGVKMLHTGDPALL